MKKRAERRKARPAIFAVPEWELVPLDPGAAEEWKVQASAARHVLLVFKMREAFMKKQPLFMPRISWIVYRPSNRILMGGQAPSLHVGQARAEAIWRIDANVRANA